MLIVIFVILILAICIYLLIFRPDPIKFFIRRYLMQRVQYGEDQLKVKGYTVVRSTEIRESFLRPQNAWLYYMPQRDGNNKKLIVVLIGGAFLFSSLNAYYGFCRVLLERLNDQSFALLLLSYPVRWNATMRDAMLSINRTLAEFERRNEFLDYHFVGFSAGALYTGTFINKEYNTELAKALDIERLGILAKSCTLVNPMIDGSSFGNVWLNRIFAWYIARGTKNAKKYSCLLRGGDSSRVIDGLGHQSVPVLAITSTRDILYEQARLVLRYMPNSQTKIFSGNEALPHSFVQQIERKESIEAIDAIVKRLLDSSI